MINYGIVGVGGFARVWVHSLEFLEDEKGIARLAAAVIRNPEKYAEEVDRLKARGVIIYATLEEMLNAGHDNLDLIGVPTGIPYHEPMAVQAMEAGYNVLIEKPAAGTIQEVRSIAQAEKHTGKWCGVAFQHIFTPTIQWFAEVLRSGKLGKLIEARSLVSWPRDLDYYSRNSWAGQLKSAGRWTLDGPATNATAHYLSHMTYLASQQSGGVFELDSVRAELYRAKDIPSYDTSCIEIITKQGVKLSHYVSHSTTENQNPISTFYCEKGTAYFDATASSIDIKYNDGTTERFVHPDAAHLHADPIRQTALVAAGQESRPNCGVREAAPHVFIINLAFESSRGCIPVAAEHTYTQGEGLKEIVAIKDMESLLWKCYENGGMYSDYDVPWAKKTQAAQAEGYESFPSAELGAILGE